MWSLKTRTCRDASTLKNKHLRFKTVIQNNHQIPSVSGQSNSLITGSLCLGELNFLSHDNLPDVWSHVFCATTDEISNIKILKEAKPMLIRCLEQLPDVF